MNADSIPKSNCKESILQNEDEEDIAVSVTKEPSIGKTVKQFHSTSLCCKISIAIGLCFAIEFSLMPIIVYYVAEIGENVIKDPEYSHDRNVSSPKVCYKLIHLHRYIPCSFDGTLLLSIASYNVCVYQFR